MCIISARVASSSAQSRMFKDRSFETVNEYAPVRGPIITCHYRTDFKSVLCAIKYGDYFCYCAYVLGISRYLSILWVVLNYAEKAELSKYFWNQKEN